MERDCLRSLSVPGGLPCAYPPNHGMISREMIPTARIRGTGADEIPFDLSGRWLDVALVVY
jgi:hypothetical protein